VNRCIAHCIESDLSPAQRLDVLETLEFTKLCELDIALMERHVGATLLVIQAMMAAVVPILIPFAEVYKDEGNLGMILSIVATGCSLLASICMAIEKARKFQETSYVGHDAAWKIYQEISLFLALAGPYKQWNSHKGPAWKKYAEAQAQLEQERDSRKNNVYGSSQAQAGVEVGKAEAGKAAAVAGAAAGGGFGAGLGIENPLAGAQDGVMGMMEEGHGALQNSMSDAQSQLQGAVGGLQGQVQGAVGGLQEQAQGALGDVADGVSSAAGQARDRLPPV